MPASEEIAPLWRSRSSMPEAWYNRAAVVTNVEKPSPVHPVHVGGRQFGPSSAGPQKFTAGESARLGRGGPESTPQGGGGAGRGGGGRRAAPRPPRPGRGRAARHTPPPPGAKQTPVRQQRDKNRTS